MKKNPKHKNGYFRLDLFVDTAVYCDIASLTENTSRTYAGTINEYWI